MTKTTIGALAVVVSLVAGFGAANAAPVQYDSFDIEAVFTREA